MAKKIDHEEEHQDVIKCSSCGQSTEPDDVECQNCGEILPDTEEMSTSNPGDDDSNELKLDFDMDEDDESEEDYDMEIPQSKTGLTGSVKRQTAGSNDLMEFGSLGDMIEKKIITTLRDREERLRESMKRSVREKERIWRERAEKRMDDLREKHENERRVLMEQLDKLRDEKENLREKLESEKEELRIKIDEHMKVLEILKEAHSAEREGIRKQFEDEKEKLRDELNREREELREKLENEMFETKEKHQEERDSLVERFENKKSELDTRIDELRLEIKNIEAKAEERREEMRQMHEAEKESLRKKLVEEKYEALELLKEERKKLQESFHSEREVLKQETKELRENMQREINELKGEKNRLREDMERERDALKVKYAEELDRVKERMDELRVKGIPTGGESIHPEIMENMSFGIKERLEKYVYPFPAIVGQERVKRSLLLNAINPDIKGVILWGPAGSGKRTALFAIADLLSDIEAVDMENIRAWNDEDRYIFGNISTSNTHANYMVDTVLKNGILGIRTPNTSKDGNMPLIFVKEISSPDKHVLSYLDSLTLHVKVDGIKDTDSRMEIIRRYKLYKQDPHSFREFYLDEIDNLRDRIVQTRQTLPGVIVNSKQRSTISNICLHNDLPAGTDIIIEEIARTVTAYDGREEIMDEDIQEALDLAMIHRVSESLHRDGYENY